jgi:hypothetical protein
VVTLSFKPIGPTRLSPSCKESVRERVFGSIGSSYVRYFCSRGEATYYDQRTDGESSIELFPRSLNRFDSLTASLLYFSPRGRVRPIRVSIVSKIRWS